MKIIDIIMKNFQVQKEEAEEILADTIAEIREVLSEGGDGVSAYEEIQDILLADLGLEMDYLPLILTEV